jgi:hypothetical protein
MKNKKFKIHTNSSNIELPETTTEITNETNNETNNDITTENTTEPSETIYNKNQIDDIFINLKIISKIDIGDKIIENDKYINIDYSYVRFVLRWLYDINRANNLKFVNNIYNQAFDLYDYFEKNNQSVYLLRLQNDLKSSIDGLNNYKQTYASDKLFQSEIDVLIENIKNKINFY